MVAAYDSYDYSAYWEGRNYEHNSEVIALKKLLDKIPKIRAIVEVGGGFGRLVPAYAYRAKRVIFSEPSAKLLQKAKSNLSNFQNITYLQSGIENIANSVPKGRTDLVLLIRVAHHLTDLESSFTTINSLLKPKGYFILEFANKLHFKAIFRHIFKGDFGYLTDLSSVDIRSPRSIKKHTIAFLNHHPALVYHSLEKSGFEVIEKLSVSNFRSPFLKKYLPMDVLISLEHAFQSLLSRLNFGPSIFVLAQKKEAE